MSATVVGPEDYAILQRACDALDARGVAYVVGGGTAVVVYGRNRRTKDFDIFLNRTVLRVALDALTHAGFSTQETDKGWLYKAWHEGLLVDLIVEARGGVTIDGDVMARARTIDFYGHDVRIMGPEDTLFRKILTLTEGRPDWYDALSIVDRQTTALDWQYFLYRARWYPRLVLGFLLFAQTELHRPPGAPRSARDNVLFPGDAPGPVPPWVVFALVEEVWLGRRESAHNPLRLPGAA